MGNFTIELNPERAPLTVAHFLKYVDQGLLYHTIFHRVVPNFVIQGGGFDADYKLKARPTKVVNESGNGLSNNAAPWGWRAPPEPHGGDVAVFREPRRQCGARSESDALGLRGIRQGGSGHGCGRIGSAMLPPARMAP